MNPQFIIYTGPMFGSKTTRLMSDIDRALYKGRKVVAFKAKKDNRYTKETISTHTGATYPAFCINHAKEILYYVNEKMHNSNTVVAVDEAFMINNIDYVIIKKKNDHQATYIDNYQKKNKHQSNICTTTK